VAGEQKIIFKEISPLTKQYPLLLRDTVIIQYQRTQIGYMVIIPIGIALFIIVACSIFNRWIAFPAFLFAFIFSLAVLLFYCLTVMITDDNLEIRFSIGLIRKKPLLRDIDQVQIVKNSWYYGWGIHLTPYGWLYNISGYDAVQIKMTSGKSFRVGTDDPLMPRSSRKRIVKWI
jgi:hypothetical protein